MNYQKLFEYMSREHGVTLLVSDIQEICNIVNEMHNQALRQPLVSGSLQDRLFELANDFAVSKQGDVAVKLHSIHNELRQTPFIKSVCQCDEAELTDKHDNCGKCNLPVRG